jgi:hypothetical protein
MEMEAVLPGLVGSHLNCLRVPACFRQGHNITTKCGEELATAGDGVNIEAPKDEARDRGHLAAAGSSGRRHACLVT